MAADFLQNLMRSRRFCFSSQGEGFRSQGKPATVGLGIAPNVGPARIDLKLDPAPISNTKDLGPET
jgi:hypothetical protein